MSKNVSISSLLAGDRGFNGQNNSSDTNDPPRETIVIHDTDEVTSGQGPTNVAISQSQPQGQPQGQLQGQQQGQQQIQLHGQLHGQLQLPPQFLSNAPFQSSLPISNNYPNNPPPQTVSSPQVPTESLQNQQTQQMELNSSQSPDKPNSLAKNQKQPKSKTTQSKAAKTKTTTKTQTKAKEKTATKTTGAKQTKPRANAKSKAAANKSNKPLDSSENEPIPANSHLRNLVSRFQTEIKLGDSDSPIIIEDGPVPELEPSPLPHSPTSKSESPNESTQPKGGQGDPMSQIPQIPQISKSASLSPSVSNLTSSDTLHESVMKDNNHNIADHIRRFQTSFQTASPSKTSISSIINMDEPEIPSLVEEATSPGLVDSKPADSKPAGNKAAGNKSANNKPADDKPSGSEKSDPSKPTETSTDKPSTKKQPAKKTEKRKLEKKPAGSNKRKKTPEAAAKPPPPPPEVIKLPPPELIDLSDKEKEKEKELPQSEDKPQEKLESPEKSEQSTLQDKPIDPEKEKQQKEKEKAKEREREREREREKELERIELEKKEKKELPIIALNIPLIDPENPKAGQSEVVVNVLKLAEDKYGWSTIHPEAKSAIEVMDDLIEDNDEEDNKDDDNKDDDNKDDENNDENKDDENKDDEDEDEEEIEEKEGTGTNYSTGNPGGQGGTNKKKKDENLTEEQLMRQHQTRMNRKVGKYDYEDPFIDDDELQWEEKISSTKEGFFVYWGPLIEERNDTGGNKKTGKKR